MRKHEIESWALQIIDRVKKDQPIEDDHVELKASWPDDEKKAARRIAGHVNAAHGEPILWLIGVDEKAGKVPGVNYIELASWYDKVRSSFDELAPEPITLNVPADGVTVAVLFFETERAPFVWKNDAGGTVQREVPWRATTGTKSATRSQLVQLLSPLQRLPEVEVVGSVLQVVTSLSGGKGEWLWRFFATLFFTQPGNQQMVLPRHRCTINISTNKPFFVEPHVGVDLSRPGFEEHATKGKGDKMSVSITGPGMIKATCVARLNEAARSELQLSSPAKVDLVLHPAGFDHAVPINYEMRRKSEDGTQVKAWEYGMTDLM